jgi:hypothetical protein
MTTIQTLSAAVCDAWASVPAPPVEDMKLMAWGWGEEAAREFTGVAPMDVDRDSQGFFTAEFLLDLSPRVAAAYLGPFILSALRDLELQKNVGIFWNVEHRAHIITCANSSNFWERVWPFLTPKCREVWVQVALYIASEHEALALTPETVATIRALADKFSKTD